MKSNHTLGPVELLILQGSPFCNINCKYCYLPDRMNKRRIARETVEKTIDQLIADQLFGTDVSIVWHAGEPLAVPLAYYQELIPLIRERVPAAVRVRHHLQTNAMLINDEWCAFIKENQIQVGISVDGPQFLNDINRRTRSGKSTFGKVMQGIAYLNEHDINYHAIAVITREAMHHPDEIYSFFKDLGVTKLGLNIEEIEGIHTQSSLSMDDSALELVASFYTQLYERQLADDKPLHIRELDDAKRKLLAIPLDYFSLHGTTQQNNPYQIISVDIDGNFSTFSPELLGQNDEAYEKFILGNVHQTGFRSAIDGALFKKWYGEIQLGIHNCEEKCPYFSFCGGGVPANKYYENASFESTQTIQCKYSIQTPLEIIMSRLEEAFQ